jgi:hypothetical protein
MNVYKYSKKWVTIIYTLNAAMKSSDALNILIRITAIIIMKIAISTKPNAPRVDLLFFKKT